MRIDAGDLEEPRPTQVADLLHAFRDLLLKCRLYPEDHPSVLAALSRWTGLLQPQHGAGKILLFQSRDDRLALNGCTVARTETAFDDASHCDAFLRLRGIRGLGFLPGLSAPETSRLIGLLHELPEGVKRAGPLSSRIERLGLTHVRINPEIRRGPADPVEREANDPSELVADRVDLFHADVAGDGDRAGELPAQDTGETDLQSADLATFDFAAHDVQQLDFTGVDERQIPDGSLEFWRLSGPQLDTLRFDFEDLVGRDDLARWDPLTLFGSQLFLRHAGGQGYRNFDDFVRAFLEAALEEAGTGTYELELLGRLRRFAEAVAAVDSPQEQAILSQRIAVLILELEPDAIVAFVRQPFPEARPLREQVLKGLVHAHALAGRVTEDLAAQASTEEDGERFLLLAEALEWLVPGRIADGDLAPTLAALKAVNRQRLTADSPILIRTRATQLLRWLCRPDLLDRLLLGTIDGDQEVSRRSREILLHFGPSAGDLLLAELKRSLNPEIRMVIVDLIAQQLTQEQSVGGTFTRSFRSLLQEMDHAEDHPWYYVRNLLLVIRKIGDDRFLEWIGRFLASDDSRVRQEALVACAQMNTPAAREMLLSVVADVDLATPDALDAVCGALADDAAFDSLSFLVGVVEQSAVTSVRLAAVIRLASLPGDEIVPHLAQILNRKRGLIGRKPYYPEPLREAAARELAQRDTDEARHSLRDLPLDPSERVRMVASEPGTGADPPPWEP